MNHEEKKAAKIVEELTMFFFSLGADCLSSDIEKYEGGIKITFCADYLPEYEQGIHLLVKAFDEPKNEGMEDIYWELAGSGDPGESSQLLLLGMMIDRYTIKKKDNKVELVLYRDTV